MNIVWMLGNGFDLNLGLKTSYKDFYEYYLNVESNDAIVKQFKQDLSENLDTWADLEFVLGKYSEKFLDDGNEQEYVELIYDIQDRLKKYLKSQDVEFWVEPASQKVFLRDFVNYDSYMTEAQKAKNADVIANRGGGTHVKVITFNYTHSLERICNWKGFGVISTSSGHVLGKIESIEHIHGTLDEYMILGVDNAGQIANPTFADSADIQHTIVKPTVNTDTETLRDIRCKDSIKNADVVCIYGMSFGETDKKWWELLITQLKQKKSSVVIFAYQRDLDERKLWKRGQIRQAIAERFLSHVQLNDEEKSEILKRIVVCVNAPIFKVERILE